MASEVHVAEIYRTYYMFILAICSDIKKNIEFSLAHLCLFMRKLSENQICFASYNRFITH